MRRFALSAILAATAAIGSVYAVALATGAAPAWGGPVFAVAIATIIVAFMMLGVARTGARIGWLWFAFAYTFAVLAGGFLLALWLPAEQAGARLILGLPVRAAIIMYGIGLFPAFVVPLAYALTFDRLTLSESDLRRVRDMRTSLGQTRAGGARGDT